MQIRDSEKPAQNRFGENQRARGAEDREEFGSFDAYLWRLRLRAASAAYRTIQEIPTTSELSDAISADLKKRGMKFVGSTIMQAYAMAVGLINAHTQTVSEYRPLSSP